MTTASALTLNPLTDAEFEVFLAHSITSFAASIGPARDLTPEDAARAAKEDFARILPDGRRTAGHLFWAAQDGSATIGHLWINTDPKPFVFGVEVDEQHRGKGYGRAIMLACEDECRRLGHRTIDLNVFGLNTTAINLYTSLGYTVTSQQMRKIL
ncbi:acetyltransferase (GNAT) family protein [Kribbella amoyensis]|uniref:Acetyltransferase (GNAT) family protein n=1 Tax=Kribbella amoyensis TaxID=996641 RepID=A0A561BNF9_9ACTN|nr:GNAT family N-acetyltransferase [Kribbella amoyensis]TWD80405.1 acetyltransferase (GNAT) family protein [Kribbella amoyensis]